MMIHSIVLVFFLASRVVALNESRFLANYSYYSAVRIPRFLIPFEGNETSNWKDSSLSSADEGRIRLDFNFSFYGHKEPHVWVDSNGFVTFWERSCPHNEPITQYCFWLTPSRWPVRFIAPFTSDFDPSASNSSRVLYQFGTTNGRSRLAITWWNVTLWNSGLVNGFTFQLILFENGEIIFSYLNLPSHPNYIRPKSFPAPYPIIIGIRDSPAVKISGKDYSSNNNAYGSVDLTFGDTSLDNSIQFIPRSTCRNAGSCDTCFPRSSGNLLCGWCEGAPMTDETGSTSSGVCRDPLGRSRFDFAQYGCSVPKDYKISRLECTTKVLDAPIIGNTSIKKIQSAKHDSSDNRQTGEAIAVGVVVGIAFFVVFGFVLRAVCVHYLQRFSAALGFEQFIPIKQTEEWKDAKFERELKLDPLKSSVTHI